MDASNLQTIVALYRTRSDAEDARVELESAGMRTEDINIAKADDSHISAMSPPHKKVGFWENLFFGSYDDIPENDRSIYHAGFNERGYALLSLRTMVPTSADHGRLITILENHNPVDIEDTDSTPTGSDAHHAYSGDEIVGDGEKQIPVVKEQSTRAKIYNVRSTVSDIPASQDVTSHDGTVNVEHRPAETTNVSVEDAAMAGNKPGTSAKP